MQSFQARCRPAARKARDEPAREEPVQVGTRASGNPFKGEEK
jgi:hypothetical protein